MDSEARIGAFHHPLMAFTNDGVPLGTVWQKTWTRETLQTSLTKAEKQKKIRATPIEQKESIRWIEGQRAARDIAAACPNTQCVCVSDSRIRHLRNVQRTTNDTGRTGFRRHTTAACGPRLPRPHDDDRSHAVGYSQY